MEVLPLLKNALKLAVQNELVSINVAKLEAEPEVKVDVQLEINPQLSHYEAEELHDQSISLKQNPLVSSLA